MLRPLAILIWLVGSALVGCASAPDPIQSSNRRTFSLDDTLQSTTLGIGDLISVKIIGHEELSTDRSSSQTPGVQVDLEGNVHLPMVGSVPVAGMTLPEVRESLTNSFGEFVRNPDITVNLRENQSRRYYILGHVQAPGSKPLDRPLTAFEALSEGSYFLRGADRRHIFVLRVHEDGLETHEFNMYQPGLDGLVQIRPDDVIYVRQTGVDNFQEDWLPILSSIGVSTLTISRTFD